MQVQKALRKWMKVFRMDAHQSSVKLRSRGRAAPSSNATTATKRPIDVISKMVTSAPSSTAAAVFAYAITWKGWQLAATSFSPLSSVSMTR